MEQVLYLLITIIESSSIISAATRTSPEMSVTPASHHDLMKTSHTFKTVSTTTTPLFTSRHITIDVSGNISPTVQLYITKSEVTASPALLSGNSLTTLAFDTDSPQVSSVRSTIVDQEDQEFNRDLLNIEGGL
ncbi:hypothetical protein E1301_Tti008175 [Triplophysa tibetana]|uniref:Uncharacterized protein n=1 Tax=Triplophysa tibetana TaxID=1572043 RepID=A0A5A9PE91_9TELE|nr:hypothetical protein E1301_Tti008175 [Triplophysa tibetana]